MIKIDSWDNLLNKILDNYTDYKLCTICEPLHTLSAVQFSYNNKIYTVVYEVFPHSEKIHSLYSVIDNNGNETFIKSRNILPLSKATKKKFYKILSKLKTLQEKQDNAKIEKENQEIYQ